MPPPIVRVGVVAPCWIHGGGEIHTLAVLKGLEPARFAIQGIAIVGGPIDRVAAPRCPWTISGAPEAVHHLLRQSDVVISWKFANLKAPLAGTSHRPRVIYVNHTVEPWSAAQAATVKDVDRLVAVSDLALDAIPGPLRSRSSIIANAVDPTRLEVRRSRAEMHKSWGVPEGAKVAGYLGRLATEKDPMAMARLARSLPPGWVVVVVGDGSLRASLAVTPGLVVAGVDPAAGDVINAFDVLVVPSLYESYGLTLAEGLWAGVPVVSTAVGVARIVPGLTRIVPVGCDGPTLAAAVLEADRSGPIRGAREWARREASPDRFAREWSDLLCSTATVAGRLAPALATSVDPAVRDRVLSCPARGPVLPISQQDDCGCRGKEVSECRRKKGKIAGRATLADCLTCQGG
jgi:glycosyltransferase involved in cell wall biosynthesis